MEPVMYLLFNDTTFYLNFMCLCIKPAYLTVIQFYRLLSLNIICYFFSRLFLVFFCIILIFSLFDLFLFRQTPLDSFIHFFILFHFLRFSFSFFSYPCSFLLGFFHAFLYCLIDNYSALNTPSITQFLFFFKLNIYKI